MKYVILIIIVILATIPFKARAITGDSSSFYWSLAQPTVTANNTNTCNNTATARFDWVLGLPTVVHDSTATCTTVVTSNGNPIVLIKGNTVIKGNTIVK